MVANGVPRMTSVAERQARQISREVGVVSAPVSVRDYSSKASSRGGGSVSSSPTSPGMSVRDDALRFPVEELGKPETAVKARKVVVSNPYVVSVPDRGFSSGGRPTGVYGENKSAVDPRGFGRVRMGVLNLLPEGRTKDALVRAETGVTRVVRRRTDELKSGLGGAFGRSVAGRDLTTRPAFEQVGNVFGVVGGVASFGTGTGGAGLSSAVGKGLKGLRVGEDAVLSKVGLGGGGLRSFVGKSVFGVGETAGVTFGGRKIARATGSQAEKNAFKMEGFGDAYYNAMRDQEKKAYSDAWYKGLFQELSPIGNKDVFVSRMRSEGVKRGLSGDSLDSWVTAGLRQRRSSQWTEPINLVNVGRLSERIGRAGVTEAFAQAGKRGVTVAEKASFAKLFGITAPSIGRAGFMEGFTGELGQQMSRNRPLDVNRALGFGSLGAVTAGALGGTIVGLSVRNPGASKLVNFGANVIDPSEKPGDLLADLQEAGLKRLGVKVKTPSISVSGKSKGGVISFAPASTKTSTKGGGKGRVGVFSFAPTSVTSPSDIFNVGKPSSPVPNPVVDPVPDIVPNPVVDPVPSVVTSPADVTSNIFSPVSSSVTTSTTTSSNIFSFTPTPVPVTVTNPRLPPPLPFGLGGSGGSGGGAGRRGKGYVNELAIGRGILSSMLGLPKPKPVKVKSKSAKVKVGGRTFKISEVGVKKSKGGVRVPAEMKNMFVAGQSLRKAFGVGR